MVNQVFTTDLLASAGGAPINGADVTITFDTTKLKVVDSNGNDASTVTVDSTKWLTTTNTANNSTGAITLNIASTNTNLTGDQVLASLRFKALATTTTTPLTLGTSSKLIFGGNEMATTLSSGSVQIFSGSAVAGSVTFQPTQRVTQITVNAYLSGSTTAAGTVSGGTDSSGVFSLTISGLVAGTYDVQVDPAHALSVQLTDQSLGPITTTTPSFGTAKEGDSNDDERVGIADFSILLATFGKSSVDTGFDSRADFDQDNDVDIFDFTLLAQNFGSKGARS